MDIQRTMEFILQSQAKAEARMDRAYERADRADERADRADARMDRLEAQVKATANLVRQGIKIVQSLARDQKETRQELRAIAVEHRGLKEDMRNLAKAQARTEATLERYIKFRSNSNNGGNRNGPSNR